MPLSTLTTRCLMNRWEVPETRTWPRKLSSQCPKNGWVYFAFECVRTLFAARFIPPRHNASEPLLSLRVAVLKSLEFVLERLFAPTRASQTAALGTYTSPRL